MFVSKKNVIYFNKPKTIDPSKPPRVLPGWQPEEQVKKQSYDYSLKAEIKAPPSASLLVDMDILDLTKQQNTKKQSSNKFYLNWDELDELDNIKCQKELIQQLVKPGGIRVKPNDNMLNEFVKEIKGMEVHVIGSLLLSKIQVNYPFQTKAKALYTIEYLIKKNQQYLAYFKAHVEKLQNFPEPEDNIDNYRKILKSLLNLIGVSSSSTQIESQKKIVFVDPGYNDDPKSQIGNFIQQNQNKVKKSEPKKTIIGPGQSKAKQVQKAQSKVQNSDFLNLDLLNGGAQPQKQINLLEQNQFSFDQMMGGLSMQAQPKNNQNFLI